MYRIVDAEMRDVTQGTCTLNADGVLEPAQ